MCALIIMVEAEIQNFNWSYHRSKVFTTMALSIAVAGVIAKAMPYNG